MKTLSTLQQTSHFYSPNRRMRSESQKSNQYLASSVMFQTVFAHRTMGLQVKRTGRLNQKTRID